MKESRKLRILDQLLDHLESMDCEELKPKSASVEVRKVGVVPNEVEGEESSEEGPMEMLVEESDEKPELVANGDDDDEMSDEDIEELLKESLG